MIVFDTNIISELLRKSPAPQVFAWFDAQPQQQLATTSITLAELRFGANALPRGKRRETLNAGITKVLDLVEVLPFDLAAAEIYGVLAADLRRRGHAVGVSDMMIAAIVLLREASLATRNTKHFVPCRVAVVNPFDG